MDLAQKTCVPCQVGAPTLTDSEIEKYLSQLGNGWQVDTSDSKVRKIRKEFTFDDFKGAINFINKVAEVAESQDHHPDIYLHDYKKVTIELFTHKIGGLHENDFILAAKIDNTVH